MKDLNLLHAMKNGFNVPDFFVVNFNEIITDMNVLINIANENRTDLKQLISDNAQNINIPYKYELSAVRSACNIEDGDHHSFAGQFDTFLNVSPQDVEERIIDCVCSLFNKNVFDYIDKNEIDTSNLKMNVIIQKMINSDMSGVLFTSNPQGILNESVIVIGEGLGDKVVTDITPVTTYYYNTTDEIYYYEGEKDLLNSKSISELISLSEKLKNIFECNYLDIEFAIESGIIYILQIRKITTLNDKNPLILDNSNIVESYPGISLPLTDSFVNVVYSGVFKGLASRVLKNEKIISNHTDVFNNMVGSANGRMYYKISNWYTIIKFLPLNKKIIPIWQDMLGVANKSYDNSKIKLSPSERAKTYINTIIEFKNVPKNMDKLNKDFIEINNNFYAAFHKNISADEIISLYEEIKTKLLSVWDITLLNDLYSFVFTGLIKNKLQKKNPDNATELLNSYISNIANLESMKPIRELVNLAVLSLDGTSKEKYADEDNHYIKEYGDRYLEELKLESETFRTSSKLLDNKIEEYTKDVKKLGDIHTALNNDETIKLPASGFLFSLCLKRAELGIKNREISRLNRSRIFGIVRTLFLALSKELVEKNVLKTEKDVFYLSIDELFSLTKEPLNMENVISNRKAQYDLFKKLPAYSRLIFTDKEFNKNHQIINSMQLANPSDKLTGTPCSNGKVMGEVLVINNVSDIKNTVGKILVTKMTDPGWVFLLSSAKGVIAEKGSLLSHTAIISRELGVPSIVGVNKATTLLKTGDIITMDGSNGTIVIMK